MPANPSTMMHCGTDFSGGTDHKEEDREVVASAACNNEQVPEPVEKRIPVVVDQEQRPARIATARRPTSTIMRRLEPLRLAKGRWQSRIHPQQNVDPNRHGIHSVRE